MKFLPKDRREFSVCGIVPAEIRRRSDFSFLVNPLIREGCEPISVSKSLDFHPLASQLHCVCLAVNTWPRQPPSLVFVRRNGVPDDLARRSFCNLAVRSAALGRSLYHPTVPRSVGSRGGRGPPGRASAIGASRPRTGLRRAASDDRGLEDCQSPASGSRSKTKNWIWTSVASLLGVASFNSRPAPNVSRIDVLIRTLGPAS